MTDGLTLLFTESLVFIHTQHADGTLDHAWLAEERWDIASVDLYITYCMKNMLLAGILIYHIVQCNALLSHYLP
jgi:hypothetical protein